MLGFFESIICLPVERIVVGCPAVDIGRAEVGDSGFFPTAVDLARDKV